MLEKEDIEGLRRARAQLSDSLYHATAQRLTTFRHVSWGVLAGVFLTAAVMDAPEKMVPRLIGGFALFLFVAYKLYARSEYKSNWLQAERLCPHKVLYPESYVELPPASRPSLSTVTEKPESGPRSKNGGCLFEIVVGLILLYGVYLAIYSFAHHK